MCNWVICVHLWQIRTLSFKDSCVILYCQKWIKVYGIKACLKRKNNRKIG